MALEKDKNGAGDRARTDDILLGRQTLYQLSYSRTDANVSRAAPLCKSENARMREAIRHGRQLARRIAAQGYV